MNIHIFVLLSENNIQKNNQNNRRLIVIQGDFIEIDDKKS